MNADELGHIIKQLAQQQTNSYRPFIYGHIATYDPGSHKAKVLFPSLGDGLGGYVLSSWLPMPGAAAGNGFGPQTIPYGGATNQNPTDGEQCLVSFLDRTRGAAAILAVYYNNNALPPSATGGYSPGDYVVKTKGGGYVYVAGDGSFIGISASTTGSVVHVQAEGTVELQVSGTTLTLGANSLDLESTGINLTGLTSIVGIVSITGALYVNGVLVNVP